MSAPTCYFPLSLLVHHFAPHPECDLFEFASSALSKIMSLAAQFWARIAALLEFFPLKLLLLGDLRLDALDRWDVVIPTFLYSMDLQCQSHLRVTLLQI